MSNFCNIFGISSPIFQNRFSNLEAYFLNPRCFPYPDTAAVNSENTRNSG